MMKIETQFDLSKGTHRTTAITTLPATATLEQMQAFDKRVQEGQQSLPEIYEQVFDEPFEPPTHVGEIAPV